ncbi:protein-glutamate methylesterase/protein-glutamine glutaminase [Psychrosphaera aestuarii]|uniref:protein-glutamate methylesterase/protein-glutamine glutaminase n=1 Tax=Psychrosphaera aestuarii TaxID=1266052 RepID=UPI001B334EA9|nr:chemotaxis response regulator protein-glutamate methylesterase [Psychrosphaera aestuarii]
MIKVLIVDDSKLIRMILTEIINASQDMTVVGEAEDPFQARDLIKLLNPDVLTLDIEMPKMDGITFLKNLMRLRPMPVVMLSTLTADGAPITLEALSIGAVDFLEKPKVDVQDSLSRYADILRDKIRAAANVNLSQILRARKRDSATPPVIPSQNLEFRKNHLIAIGASTGGTEAIKDVVINLPANFCPIVVTQHIPPVFSKTYAERLDKVCQMSVHEAQHGQIIEPGNIYIAPGDKHLTVLKRGSKLFCQLDDSEPVNRHKPAVDVLFDSVAAYMGKYSTGVILTGMGADGAKGLLNLKASGAYTITQDESSSVVYGMPRAAKELGAGMQELPLNKIANRLAELATRVV